MIGRKPAIAAPTPSPANPSSVIGVSITRLGPKFFQQATRDFISALIFSNFLAHQKDGRIARQLFFKSEVQSVAHCHYSHCLIFSILDFD
jgi:hypothetical protein